MNNLSLGERIKSLTPEQEIDILLLELHRQIKRGVLNFSEYERAKEMWKI